MENEQAQRADFRRALGAFATGVTIVTTSAANGDPVGVTASSFNSVSVDPPLVLWSLAKSAKAYSVFEGARHFAIHVLADDQMPLANIFARSGFDKFAAIDWSCNRFGVPIFDHYVALFESQVLHRYEGGDHVILVGEVVAFDRRNIAPLLFYGGAYAGGVIPLARTA